MPTRLWNAATSCGIAVIWILRAVTRPIAAADRRIARDDLRRCEAIWWTCASVVPTAIAMPTMPECCRGGCFRGPTSPAARG